MLLLVALVAALAAAGSVPRLALGRPAGARLRRRGRRLLAAAAVVARRRGDDARRALRAPAPPAPARRVPARTARDPRPALVAADRAHGRRRRGRARRVGARRRLPGAAPVVARLGRPRLVLRAARAHLPLPVGPPGELDPEHGRGEPRAPAGVDVPQPARDARTRSSSRCSARSPRSGRAGGRSPPRRSSTRALLWTHTRAAFIALPVGLLVLAALRRSWAPVGLAVGSVAVSVAFVALFPTIGPTTTYTETELACLRENAAVEGASHGRPVLERRELDLEPPERAPRRDPRRSPATPGATASGTRASRRRAPEST